MRRRSPRSQNKTSDWSLIRLDEAELQDHQNSAAKLLSEPPVAQDAVSTSSQQVKIRTLIALAVSSRFSASAAVSSRRTVAFRISHPIEREKTFILDASGDRIQAGSFSQPFFGNATCTTTCKAG